MTEKFYNVQVTLLGNQPAELLEVDLEHESAKVVVGSEEKIIPVSEVVHPEILIVKQAMIDEGGDYEALTIDKNYIILYNL